MNVASSWGVQRENQPYPLGKTRGSEKEKKQNVPISFKQKGSQSQPNNLLINSQSNNWQSFDTLIKEWKRYRRTDSHFPAVCCMHEWVCFVWDVLLIPISMIPMMPILNLSLLSLPVTISLVFHWHSWAVTCETGSCSMLVHFFLLQHQKGNHFVMYSSNVVCNTGSFSRQNFNICHFKRSNKLLFEFIHYY